MFLNIVLDVILVAILIGGSGYGYNKGLFKMTAGPVRLFLCIVVSLTYCSAVGSNFIAPILQNTFKNSGTPILNTVVGIISTAVAFGILFLLIKTAISFLVSLINRLLEKGIVGKINSGLGFVFAGSIAFLTAISITTFSQYLIKQYFFLDIEAVSDFSGGPLYKFFTLISPDWLIFTN